MTAVNGRFVKNSHYFHSGYSEIKAKMSLKLICGSLFTKLNPISMKNVISISRFHTSAMAAGKINRFKDRTAMLRTVNKKDDGVLGEHSMDIDSVTERFVSYENIFIDSEMALEIMIHCVSVNNSSDTLISILQRHYTAIQPSKIYTFVISVSQRITQLSRLVTARVKCWPLIHAERRDTKTVAKAQTSLAKPQLSH